MPILCWRFCLFEWRTLAGKLEEAAEPSFGLVSSLVLREEGG